MIYLLLFAVLKISAQDDDYFEDSNPSRFKIFGPFKDPPIHLARTTTEISSFDNETTTNGSTRDEFILGETVSSNNNFGSPNSLPVAQANNNCQYACQPISNCVPQSCTCAAPKLVCIPRPPPICPPPPLPLICPPPACPKPVACPPCVQIPTPCITPAVVPQPQNDCCCNCNQPCRTTHHRSKFLMHGTRTLDTEQNMSRCNSQEMRKLIRENITADLENSKHRIQIAAQQMLRKTLNIICGHGEFSYIVQTQTYCQYSIGHTTCYVFESI